MTKIGYARTSTVEQNLDSQIIALKAANCEIIRTEQKSGNNLADRKELNNILDFIHKDEYLVVTRIDRLARSLKDLQIIVDLLKAKGAHLIAIEQPVNTSTATGKAFFDMLGIFAEFETNLRRERQADGIAAAKIKGIYKGRPPSICQDKIKQHLLEGKRPTQIAKELEISRGTIYKIKQLITLEPSTIATNLDS
ncbi:Recombinase family protein [Candidatus Trichorickettsia mobilis]|uniref:Recombinase family protein n=1 Tax=Candidatus Trichorickettsia mobilis TaxID=1346319 RepID=A0ABZ0UTC9_9RICK|nr:recombinase family protein [Candidatus Trichorickettsia mobilis]WPY01290.1 Recombinase family protein [Candidatus Trichorickettsia mobilis]